MAQMQHRRMLPIGPLMIEHRLIDRMIQLMRMELDRIGKYGRADTEFIDSAVSFMRDYADVCHHGKEERILFRDLAEKPMAADLKRIMEDLIQEHILMRKLTNDLVRAKEGYLQEDPRAKADIILSLNSVIELYPRHIEKEDKHFFIPSMSYLSDAEKDLMIENFREFDSRILHDIYSAMVKGLEETWHPPEGAISK